MRAGALLRTTPIPCTSQPMRDTVAPPARRLDGFAHAFHEGGSHPCARTLWARSPRSRIECNRNMSMREKRQAPQVRTRMRQSGSAGSDLSPVPARGIPRHGAASADTDVPRL
ncbi:hypothetical protein HYPSUDRAFT_65109 [Hypholoma sublateritium FD-334 SS-4]|uniref:Uncharacterized protein n=1 Tax=Hypholoma sublateritium (strain FD-334 SS-4) TaxID=945553 RepID=A0A0D2Q0W8_HYPSF|nr:hypothetical protein HYPSUDRAFT_65109 [Hypholoma sublateritium FD-334 SS-4]